MEAIGERHGETRRLEAVHQHVGRFLAPNGRVVGDVDDLAQVDFLAGLFGELSAFLGQWTVEIFLAFSGRGGKAVADEEDFVAATEDELQVVHDELR